MTLKANKIQKSIVAQINPMNKRNLDINEHYLKRKVDFMNEDCHTKKRSREDFH